jgi:energy-coupling factor transporter transmembrane protein EcfT
MRSRRATPTGCWSTRLEGIFIGNIVAASLHPASRILTYLLAALAISGLPFFMLPLLLFGALAADSPRHPWRVIWRTRWLLLVLFLGYAYSLPGEPVLAWLDGLSPTIEGLARGGQQALRLLVLLLWLDVLVLRLPTAALMAGVYTLLRPFARLGLEVERAALRLGLTLRAIEGLERGRGNLRRLLGEEAGSDLPASVYLDIQSMRLRDLLLPTLIGTLLLWSSA